MSRHEKRRLREEIISWIMIGGWILAFAALIFGAFFWSGYEKAYDKAYMEGYTEGMTKKDLMIAEVITGLDRTGDGIVSHGYVSEYIQVDTSGHVISYLPYAYGRDPRA